jgi:hypothetical protein
MGLHPAWIDYGFVDEQFIDTAFDELSEESPDEHCRTPFYAKFFRDREHTGISHDEIKKYLALVSHDPDQVLKAWALSFLVEHDKLSKEDLILVAKHDLIRASEKHLLLIRRRVANFD